MSLGLLLSAGNRLAVPAQAAAYDASSAALLGGDMLKRCPEQLTD